MNLPPPDVTAWIVAEFTILIVLMIAFSSIRVKQEPKPLTLPVTHEFRRNRRDFFVIGTPIGLGLAILTHIPFIADLAKWQETWYLPLVQAPPLVFYVGLLAIISGYRIITAAVRLNTTERKGITDGIFTMFVVFQIVLFILGYLEVFFPTVNPHLHNGLLVSSNST